MGLGSGGISVSSIQSVTSSAEKSNGKPCRVV
jgi:hypothetical protein